MHLHPLPASVVLTRAPGMADWVAGLTQMVAAIWTAMSSHEFSARPMALKIAQSLYRGCGACVKRSGYQWSMAFNEDS